MAPFLYAFGGTKLTFEITLEEDEKTAIEEATSSETFDVFDYVDNHTNTPDLTATVYTDADLALKINDLKEKQKAIEGKQRQQADEYSIIDDDDPDYGEEIAELIDQAKGSALSFKFKGLAPKALEAFQLNYEASNAEFRKDHTEEEYNIKFNNALVAKTLVSVTNAAGQVSSNAWTGEKVKDFLGRLYVSEQAKIYATAARANYVGAVFDAAVSADF